MSTAMRLTAFRFRFNDEDPIIASPGGPGLGWRYALNDALRERGRRRGTEGWRGLRHTAIVEVTDTHAKVTTSRGEKVDLFVTTHDHVGADSNS